MSYKLDITKFTASFADLAGYRKAEDKRIRLPPRNRVINYTCVFGFSLETRGAR